MKATHEHEWEAAPGLPSALPPGERVVWQGAPDTYRVQPRASFAGPIGSFLLGLRRAVPVPPRINDAARAAELARNLSAYPAQRRTMRAALDARHHAEVMEMVLDESGSDALRLALVALKASLAEVSV
mgnify:CR=1 FL=1